MTSSRKTRAWDTGNGEASKLAIVCSIFANTDSSEGLTVADLSRDDRLQKLYVGNPAGLRSYLNYAVTTLVASGIIELHRKARPKRYTFNVRGYEASVVADLEAIRAFYFNNLNSRFVQFISTKL